MRYMPRSPASAFLLSARGPAPEPAMLICTDGQGTIAFPAWPEASLSRAERSVRDEPGRRWMNTKGPLVLPREEAQKIKHEILMLQPFAHQSWPAQRRQALKEVHASPERFQKRTLHTLRMMDAWARASVGTGNCRCARTGAILACARPDRTELLRDRLPRPLGQKVPRHRLQRASLDFLLSPPIRLVPKPEVE